jgi:hypothetical protein
MGVKYRGQWTYRMPRLSKAHVESTARLEFDCRQFARPVKLSHKFKIGDVVHYKHRALKRLLAESI